MSMSGAIALTFVILMYESIVPFDLVARTVLKGYVMSSAPFAEMLPVYDTIVRYNTSDNQWSDEFDMRPLLEATNTIMMLPT